MVTVTGAASTAGLPEEAASHEEETHRLTAKNDETKGPRNGVGVREGLRGVIFE